MTKRVVITGVGVISPLGLTAEDTWRALTAGTSGVGPITQFDPENLLVKIACEVRGFEPTNYLDMRDARRRDRFEQFAAAATQEAMAQSGLQITPENAGRVGVIISSATGGINSFEEAMLTIFKEGPRRLSPFVIPMYMSNGASGMVAIDTGAKGPSFSVASACASGADGVGQAWTLLRAGVIDAAITGGSEATICEMGIGAFDRLGALSRQNDNYTKTPAPFDKSRDGLVMGEGCGILILETLDHAEARGATILAEMVGYSATADAFHITAPAEQGEGGSAAIVNALAIAGLKPEQVDYINAHGTGTDLNDVSETRAIKSALGDHAYRVAISSTKSMTGHMMGATGALEAIFCVKTIRSGVVPPTINLHDPDPECDLDYVPNQARQMPVRVAISNAFGFGGHNAVLAFQAFSR
ncbi:MAG TPA: beta-ketoacyl-ACP synthase II [Anaerolineales bacterium]|jgi:beta-ketoacyl-acyl-carrier-protein synthase II